MVWIPLLPSGIAMCQSGRKSHRAVGCGEVRTASFVFRDSCGSLCSPHPTNYELLVPDITVGSLIMTGDFAMGKAMLLDGVAVMNSCLHPVCHMVASTLKWL